jgi:hypothetical protein
MEDGERSGVSRHTEWEWPSLPDVGAVNGTVFLSPGGAKEAKWHEVVVDSVRDLPVGVIANKKRASEDADDASDEEARARVAWAREVRAVTDVVAVCLESGEGLVGSLMQLGEQAQACARKVICCCGPRMWCRGEVEAMAKVEGFMVVESHEALAKAVRVRLEEVMEALWPKCHVM